MAFKMCALFFFVTAWFCPSHKSPDSIVYCFPLHFVVESLSNRIPWAHRKSQTILLNSFSLTWVSLLFRNDMRIWVGWTECLLCIVVCFACVFIWKKCNSKRVRAQHKLSHFSGALAIYCHPQKVAMHKMNLKTDCHIFIPLTMMVLWVME